MSQLAPSPILTHETRLACDGGGGALGHPRVWLNLERNGAVDCPYCGRAYRLAGPDDPPPSAEGRPSGFDTAVPGEGSHH